jgi:hypothetical protein
MWTRWRFEFVCIIAITLPIIFKHFHEKLKRYGNSIEPLPIFLLSVSIKEGKVLHVASQLPKSEPNTLLKSNPAHPANAQPFVPTGGSQTSPPYL